MTSISEESFIKIFASEEIGCLPSTFSEIANKAVSLDEIKPCRKEALCKQNNHDELEQEEYTGGPINIVNTVKEGAEKKVHEKDCVRDENKMTSKVSLDKVPTLADPEESESESEQFVVVHEILNTGTCEECFEFLEENAEHFKKLKCAEGIYLKDLSYEGTDMFDETVRLNESERFFKTSHHNVNRDSSGSFRASVHSLSICHDSIPSSTGCPSQKDLFLDRECRICRDAEGHDLISPCRCVGTSKWVHQSCIMRWIHQTKTKQCEICTCPITVQRRKKPINQWTRPSATCGPCNKLDIWCCFVLALCVLITIAFVVLQSHYDVTDQLEMTVIFAFIYVLCGMIIMMKARYFWSWFVQRSSFWRNWKNLNEEWQIIEVNKANFQGPVSNV